MVSRAAIDQFLSEPSLAIVGVSRTGKKFGNLALRTLHEKGYLVYPIHRSADVIDGVRCYRDFTSLPEPVRAVLVVVPPAEAVGVVRDAHRAGVSKVWLQQGSESPAVLDVCARLGIQPIVGECVLMFADPSSYHKAHWWVRKVLGKIPA